MNIEQFTGNIREKFDVVDIVDLAKLSATPNAAFKFFKNIYRSEYDVNCRIVIYTNQTDISNELLSHLYKTVNFIDISNWFVLLCTPTNISKQLEQICKESSTDPVAFQNLIVDINDGELLETNFVLPETMCAVPWSNLEICSDGSITPCCMSTKIVGNIKDISLDSAFHSDAMNQFRQDFLDGKKPKECNWCWKTEERGLTSIRQHNTGRLKETFLTKRIDNPIISTIDLKFQNTCNFKCRICNPEQSSLFADESRKHLSIQILPSVKWSESDKFINEFTELLPQLTNIDMYGGEPFLIKKFSRVLKHAVDTNVAKNIRLHYNSNGSVWPEEFIEYWPNFKEVDIHFSIDALNDRFNLQRGGNWKDVESNILKIKNLNLPNLNISLMPSISIMNVLYIDEVVDWASKHNFQIFVSYVREPVEFSISQLTPTAKELVLNKHKNNPWPEMKNILHSIELSPGSDGQAFCKKIKYFDTVRNENFAESHPEIAEAMGYVYNNNL